MVDLSWTGRGLAEPPDKVVSTIDSGRPAAAGQAVAGAISDPGFDTRRLFGALWRQLGWFVAIAGSLFATAVLIIHLLTPIYRATALVMVDPPNAAILDPLAPQPIADPVRVDSEVEILRSSVILASVVAAQRLAEDPEFAPQPSLGRELGAWILGTSYSAQPGSDAEALRRLGSKVRIERRGETALIGIDARSNSAKKAAKIANAIFAAYLDAQIEAKSERLVAIGRRLDGQLARARALSSAADLRLDNFLRDNLGSLSDTDLRDELTALQQKLSAADSRRAQFDALAARSRDRAALGDWRALTTELTSDRLDDLRRRREALQTSVQPDGDGRARRIASIDGDLHKEADAIIQRIATAAEAAQTEEGELRQRLASRLAAPDIPTELVLRFREAESDASALRQVVDKLTTSAREAEAGGDAPLPDTRLIAPALAPIDPIFPDIALFTLLSACLALVGGVILAVIRDSHDQAYAAKALKS